MDHIPPALWGAPLIFALGGGLLLLLRRIHSALLRFGLIGLASLLLAGSVGILALGRNFSGVDLDAGSTGYALWIGLVTLTWLIGWTWLVHRHHVRLR